MTRLVVSEDIVPVSEAEARLSSILRDLRARGRPVVITQDDRPVGVVLTPEEYDRLTYHERFVGAVERGLAEADAGLGHSTDEVRAILQRDLGPREAAG